MTPHHSCASGGSVNLGNIGRDAVSGSARHDFVALDCLHRELFVAGLGHLREVNGALHPAPSVATTLYSFKLHRSPQES